jgi:hypothetical protein
MGSHKRSHDEECNRIDGNEFQTKFWIITKAGQPISLAEYCKKPIAEANGTVHISQVLQVEANALKLKFQCHLQDHFTSMKIYAYWCACHPNSTHDDGTLPDGCYSNVRLYEGSNKNKFLDGRLFNQLCIFPSCH